MKTLILLITQLSANIDGAKFENITFEMSHIENTVYIKLDEIFKGDFE